MKEKIELVCEMYTTVCDYFDINILLNTLNESGIEYKFNSREEFSNFIFEIKRALRVDYNIK